MPYLFFLGVVPLPITPSALSIKTPSLNKTVTLVNEGEINIPKTAGLREISFEFLLPQVQQYPFANYQLGSYTASVMIPLLNKWKSMMLPFRFIVTRMSPSNKILYFTYIKCLIEDFTYDEDAEAHGLDVMCSINLKEYVDYGTKIFDKKNDATNTATVTKTRPTTGKKIPSSVKANKEDTLPNLSKEITGSFNDWYDFAVENNYQVPDVSDEISANITDSLIEDGIIQPKQELTSTFFPPPKSAVQTVVEPMINSEVNYYKSVITPIESGTKINVPISKQRPSFTTVKSAGASMGGMGVFF